LFMSLIKELTVISKPADGMESRESFLWISMANRWFSVRIVTLIATFQPSNSRRKVLRTKIESFLKSFFLNLSFLKNQRLYF
jgi:hypothetical protein